MGLGGSPVSIAFFRGAVGSGTGMAFISAWEYRASSLYIPSSAEDAEVHTQEMIRWGADSDEELINTHRGYFFPHLRKKIQDSWTRVFTQLNADPGIIAFTVWELRREWIEEIQMMVKTDTPGNNLQIF